MKTRFSLLLLTVSLVFTGSACGGSGFGPGARDTAVSFRPLSGAPSFAPVAPGQVAVYMPEHALPAGITRGVVGAMAAIDVPSAEAPHLQLGEVWYSGLGRGNHLPRLTVVAMLADEARKHGATAIVIDKCDDIECSASAFRLSLVTASAAVPAEAIIPPFGREPILAPPPPPPSPENPIKNNPALGEAMLALATPGASGKVPEEALATFERELLQSFVYQAHQKGTISSRPPPPDDGTSVFFADEASVRAHDPEAWPVPERAMDVLEAASTANRRLFIHYERRLRVGRLLGQDEIKKLLEQAKKK